jgi:uncharacterized membrane protein YeaQ/YmgE (transglycosylase-associated protein family)
MGIIGTIFIGLIVGLLARFLKPGDDSMGWIMTILLGIGGSLAATGWRQAWASIRQVKAQASSVRWSARSCCW